MHSALSHKNGENYDIGMQTINQLIFPFRNIVRPASSWSCLSNFDHYMLNINDPVTIGFVWKLWDIMLKTVQWKILCDQ